MILQFIVYFGIVLLIETGLLTQLKYLIFDSNTLEQPLTQQQFTLEEQYGDIQKDSDVINEEKRISRKEMNQEIFVVDRLTKYYSRFMAVKGISFSLDSSECFGLLGVNGAGKTSTFKMITGDELITKGEAYFNSLSQTSRIDLKSNIKQFQKKLGYCPQFDPLIGILFLNIILFN
jgi:ATP-binding cassette, subfamily A (ABC1), member 3